MPRARILFAGAARFAAGCPGERHQAELLAHLAARWSAPGWKSTDLGHNTPHSRGNRDGVSAPPGRAAPWSGSRHGSRAFHGPDSRYHRAATIDPDPTGILLGSAQKGQVGCRPRALGSRSCCRPRPITAGRRNVPTSNRGVVSHQRSPRQGGAIHPANHCIGQAAAAVPQARKQIFAMMYPQFYGFSPSYVTISATGL